MPQYIEIDPFDNVKGFVAADDMPERVGFRYEEQDPPVTSFPAPPFPRAQLRRTDGVTYWHDPRNLAERIEDASADVVARLTALDATLVRPMGEVTEALATAAAVPSEALGRVQAINATKAVLRSILAAIPACTSAEALADLLATLPTP